MAFLRAGLLTEGDPQLRGPRLSLRVPTMADYVVWAELRAASRTHLAPWEPTWTPDELSRGAFRRRIRVHQRDQRDETGIAFFLFNRHNNALVGGLTLSNIRRGVTQAGALGYWVGAPFAGQGLMSEAVAVLVPYAFDTLGLHRLEAACLPDNTASMRVLEKNGFAREGLARKYLKINGAWQDHVLFALVEDDPRPSAPWRGL